MIVIAPLRTPRLQVEMRELSARDAIALCQLPVDSHEHGITRLLQAVVVPTDNPREGQVTDPRLWSVQERGLAVAHYLNHVIGEDFAIGDGGAVFSDYLLPEGIGAPPAPEPLGEIAGKEWFIQPLLGWHAEAIERLVEAGELKLNEQEDGNLGGWLLGAMGAQIYSADQEPLDLANALDSAIDSAIDERADALLNLGQTDFMQLVQAYYLAEPLMAHIFYMTVGVDGFVFMPSREVPVQTPARFHFSAALQEDALQIFGAINRADT